MKKQLLKEYAGRFLVCALGLVLFGLGNFLGVKAGSAGTNAWSTLSLGLADMTGLSFGINNFIISLIIIVIDILGKGKMGFGTVMNAVLISLFSDVFINIFSFIPNATNPVVGTVLSMLGQTVIAFAIVFYTRPALGCGPRDTLMVLFAKAFPKAPIGVVKFGLEIIVLVIGVVMGAPFGVATVLTLALQSFIFQFVCRIMKYDIRTIEHEDMLDTIKRFKEAK